jgi:Methyltransferase domain
MRSFIGKILTKIPYIRYAYLYKHNSSFRPGHYYSPVADIDDIKQREAEIWAPRTLPGIDLNEHAQKEFLHYLLDNETNFKIPWEKNQSRKYYGNAPSYTYVDGVVLYAMMMKYRPKNVIEVGAGASSGCMFDASKNSGIKTDFTLIEPLPDYCLEKVFSAEERKWEGIRLIQEKVQKVPINTFQTLKQNDILFIDTSHVAKPGSEVSYLLTQVLPTLNEGVLVHFHDIYYPFEYTREYLLELKLLWNEAYCLHNFLLFNSHFKILFFSDYMRLKVQEDPLFASQFNNVRTSDFCKHPTRPKNIWLVRVK